MPDKIWLTELTKKIGSGRQSPGTSLWCPFFRSIFLFTKFGLKIFLQLLGLERKRRNFYFSTKPLCLFHETSVSYTSATIITNLVVHGLWIFGFVYVFQKFAARLENGSRNKVYLYKLFSWELNTKITITCFYTWIELLKTRFLSFKYWNW